MKNSLADIVTGDKVISLANGKLRLVEVTHTTKTQIHIGTIKYRKNGSELSDDKWHSSQIFAPLQKQVPSIEDSQTWLDCYQEQQEKLKAEKQSLIEQIALVDMSKIPASTLKQVLSLLTNK